MTEDDWMVAAMTDCSLVADLLIHLRKSAPPEMEEHSPEFPLKWRVRQRRSRPMLQTKTTTIPRDSPTTPLSWSGATSLSGANGFEESNSSQPPSEYPDATRSKVTAASTNLTNKRSKKKKTLTELKEEENLVLKERRDLKKELATLRVAVEIERATNDQLKRLKVDFGSRPATEGVTLVRPADVRIDDHKCVEQPYLIGSSKPHQEFKNQENTFLLPDLNLPIDDFNTQAIDRAETDQAHLGNSFLR